MQVNNVVSNIKGLLTQALLHKMIRQAKSRKNGLDPRDDAIYQKTEQISPNL